MKIQLVKILFALVLLLLLSLEIVFFFQKKWSIEHWWDNIPAFYVLLGFFGFCVFVGFSKSIGVVVLRKKK